MKNHQDNTNALPALLRIANGGDPLETNSPCCAAAGITAPSSPTAEALVPHEKLRRATLGRNLNWARRTAMAKAYRRTTRKQ